MRKKDAEEALVVNKIFERDIDLLLVEELRCNREFLRLFLTKAGWPDIYETVETYHSQYMTYGEADVEAVLTYPDGACRVLLIEDKINAQTQKDQSQRYTENAEEILKDVEFSDVKAFLVAPEKYMRDHENDSNIADFKARVTYEELIAFFEKYGNDKRFQYKAELLQFAIDKHKRLTEKVVDQRITAFYRLMKDYVDKHYSTLKFIDKSEEKSKNDEYWVKWYSPIKNANIYWKADNGYIDLQVAGCGDRVEEFIEKFKGKLLPGMYIEKASGSAVFRMKNPCWKMSFREVSFPDNIILIDHALKTAALVYAFVDTLPEDVFQ